MDNFFSYMNYKDIKPGDIITFLGIDNKKYTEKVETNYTLRGFPGEVNKKEFWTYYNEFIHDQVRHLLKINNHLITETKDNITTKEFNKLARSH